MILIDTLVLGSYGTNCYIARAEGSESCAVIDPGYQPDKILAHTDRLGLKVEAILLTHGHFDHVGGVEQIVRKTGCALWMKESDYTMRSNPMSDYLYPIHDCDFTEVRFCEEGEVIHAGGLTFTVMETPGHTWGSVCYRCGDALFSGDTLFAGSCGRTDLPGGNWDVIRDSLARLSDLPDEVQVYPGHGESSTIAREKKVNPYL